MNFGAVGTWLRQNATWILLSPDGPDYMVPARIDGDAADEIIAISGPWAQSLERRPLEPGLRR